MESTASKWVYFLIILLSIVIVHGENNRYNVHWLNGPTSVDRGAPTLKQTLDIYCYPGSSKSILALWQTVKFNIRINSDDFSCYTGTTPDEVFNQYYEDKYGWAPAIMPFRNKAARSISLDLFNSTCLTVNTNKKYGIDLQILRVDIWRVLVMAIGIALISSSRILSGNPIFFYFCGILIGVSASFMVLVYYISKLLPRKTFTYGILIGGWTVGVYIFQQLWENIRSILLSYQLHLFWYSLVVGFISFLVCYRIGPPQNRRSRNLVMWTLQVLGVLMIFLSSEYREASAAVVVITLIFKYFPKVLLYRIQSYLHVKFPPKPRLLSNEEYYEQGARETKKALEDLRKHCSSPDCAQWKIMLKLNDSKRFASFVEGDSHLSDDEVLGYESYAFSMDSSRKPAPVVDESSDDDEVDHLEISDDESSDDL